VEVATVPADGVDGIDLPAALAQLGGRGLTRLCSEGGPRLAEALARADSDIGALRGRVEYLEAVERELAVCRAECAQLRVDLAGIKGSLSWRLTAPIRLAAGQARALLDRR
jgi:hypothetical protein